MQQVMDPQTLDNSTPIETFVNIFTTFSFSAAAMIFHQNIFVPSLKLTPPTPVFSDFLPVCNHRASCQSLY
jgi:hypothetical protein